MKKNLKTTVIAAVLAVIMTVTAPLQLFAVASNPNTVVGQKLYVSEVRMASSKAWLEDNGYIVIDNELNAKTKEEDVFLGYRTTINPDEAITDIAVMDMNGGYYRTDYRKMMEEYSLQLRTMTDELIIAAEEFRANYAVGSPAAFAACKVLNYLYVDDADNQPLGDWIVSGSYTRELIFDMIMMCDQVILALIYNQLAVGCQSYGESWIEKLSAYGTGKSVKYGTDGKPIWQDYEDSPEELTDEEYFEGAYALQTAVEMYAKICNAALARRAANGGKTVLPTVSNKEELEKQYDSEDLKLTVDEVTAASDGDAVTLGVYDFLSSYQYGNGTVADLFMHERIDDFSVLYPIVKALTPAQLAMMKVVGVTVMAATATNTKAAYADLDAIYSEISEGTTCSVWSGANRVVYDGEIGVTDAAKRQMSSSGDFRALTSDMETLRDKTVMIAKCVGVVLCATVAAYCITVSLVSIVGLVSSCSIASAAFSFCLTATIVSTGLGYASVFIAAVLVIVLLVALGDYIVEWYEEYHPEFSSIPDIMYDVNFVNDEDVEYIRYDVVQNADGNPGDLNAWEGREWNAVYTTKDRAAGSPLVADGNGEIFCVQYDNGTTPTGYKPMHYFGYKYAMDTNDHVFDHNVSIYVFFHTEDAASGSPINGSGKTLYLREVYLECRSSGDSARYSLENKGYTVVNMDLTPFSEDAVYMGYKTTTNSRLALTDIRLAYAHNAEVYMFGEASYGNCGTAMDLTLYATKYACAGSPILADIYATKTIGAPEGYEPIALFSGGNAFDFNIISEIAFSRTDFGLKDYVDYDEWDDYNTFLYYKPSVAYTEGPDYVSGFTFFQYNLNGFHNSDIVWESFERMAQIIGVTSTGQEMFQDGDKFAFSLMCYTTTKNPYRALRIVKSYGIDDEEGAIPQNLVLGGLGFSAVQPYNLYINEPRGHRWMEKGNTYISQRVTEGAWLDGNAERATGMYVAAATTRGTPFTYDDILFKSDNTAVPEGYFPVTSINEMYSYNAADLASGNGGGVFVHMYIAGEMLTEPEYISAICLTDKGGDEGLLTLLASGCDVLCANQLGKSDKLMVGVVRTGKKTQAIRDIRYVLTETDKKPAITKKINGITYTLASEKCTYIQLERDRVEGLSFDAASTGYYAWVYYTLNPKAGSPLLDIEVKASSDSMDGYTVIKDESGYPAVSLKPTTPYSLEMQNYSNLSVRRDSAGKYITSIGVFHGQNDQSITAVTSGGFVNYLDYDFNYNTDYNGADGTWDENDAVLIAYDRTSEPQAAITGIVAVHNKDALPEIVYNGITYYLASETDLNVTAGGDFIYLYCTNDAAAGKPITDIAGVDRVGNNEVVQRVDGGSSNFNAGTDADDCDGGNDCYLAVWRDTETDLTIIDGLWSVASVFTDSPRAVVIICMVLLMLFNAAAAIAFKKKNDTFLHK